MYRWILRWMVIFLLLCGASTGFAAPFTDIEEGSKYTDALTFLKERQVIQGYDDGAFRPHVIVNRVEALKMLLVASGITADTTLAIEYDFSDIDWEAWYMPYLNEALHLGIVEGYPDGLFRPGQTINRVEALKIAFHTFGVATEGITVTEQLYTDIPLSIDTAWFAKHVAYARAANLLEPKKTGVFAPADGMTRGDMAELLYRIMYIQENKLERFTSGYSGEISYYADQFEGRGTAYGETFRQEYFSAANMTYPHGTFIQIVDHNTDKSVVAKINDKGPYTVGRIVDLSRVSFSALGRLSRGISQGEIRRLFQNTSLDKFIIGRTVFTGITLDRGIPNIMQQGEYYRIAGATKESVVRITVQAEQGGSPWEAEIPVVDGRFSTSVPFITTGNVRMTLATPTNATTKTLHVLSPVLGTMELGDAVAPEQLRGETTSQGVRFVWEGHGQSLFRIVFYQDAHRVERFVNGSSSYIAKVGEFEGFEAGPISWYVEAAVSSTVFSHDRYTSWAKSAVEEFYAETTQPTHTTDAVTITDIRREGNLTTVYGTVQEAVQPVVYMTLPSGYVQQQPFSNTTSFAIGLPQEGAGVYILEILKQNGDTALLLPVSVGNTYTVLPKQLPSIAVTVKEMVIALVSTERAKYGLTELHKDAQIQNFAELIVREGLQWKSTTHDGYTRADMQQLYGIEGSVYIVTASGSTLYEQYETMRTRPSLREQLLMPTTSQVGIVSTSDALTLVQAPAALTIGSGTTLMDTQVASLGVRTGQMLQRDIQLERIAQVWTDIMVRHGVFALEHEQKSLSGLLGRFSFPKAVKTYILTASNDAQLEDKILELSTLSSDQTYTNIGIGIVKANNGLITAVVLYY